MADVKVAATAKPVAKAVAAANPVAAKPAATKPATAKPAEVKVEAKTEVVKKAAPVKKAAAKKEAPKKETVKKETAKKAPANKSEEKAIVNLQFDGKSYTAEDLVRIAKDVWQYDLQKKPADFDTVELYVKPEESQVYYVINEEVTGCFAI